MPKNKKNKKSIRPNSVPLSLIPWPGGAKFGFYVNIAKTDWRGAKNMVVPTVEMQSAEQALSDTTFYFPPVCEQFNFERWSPWAETVKFNCRFEGRHLHVNALYLRDTGNLTLNMFFRDGKWTPSDYDSWMQYKTSGFYNMLLEATKSGLAATPKQREELRELYRQYGLTPDWIVTLCGDAGVESMSSLKALCACDAISSLLSLFKTLSTFDYAMQLRLIPNDVIYSQIYVTKEVLYDVEARCANAYTKVSNLDFKNLGYCPYHGDVSKFGYLHGKTLGSKGAFALVYRAHTDNGDVDVDEVSRHMAEHYFYVGEDGIPCADYDFTVESKAAFACHGTGLLTSGTGKPELFAVYKKVGPAWEFAGFMPLVLAMPMMKDAGLRVDHPMWSILIGTSYRQEGKGVRFEPDEDNTDRDLPSFVPFYKCSQELLDMVADCANIKTLDDANTFIDSFIRLLRRRHIYNDYKSMYNTGLCSKQGDNIWIAVPNLNGDTRYVQPYIIRDVSSTSEPILPAKTPSYLVLSPAKAITLDVHSFRHSLEERGYRLPETVNDMSFDVLIDKVKASIRVTNMMVRHNPFYAQPMWSETDDRIYHLIPLYGNSFTKENLLGALLVRKGRVVTLYSIDMARMHSVFVQSPPAQWLYDVYCEE